MDDAFFDKTLEKLDFDHLCDLTGSIYEATVIVSRYAKQVRKGRQESFEMAISLIAPVEDGEVDFSKDLEILSKKHEKLPKPTLEAAAAFLSQDLEISYKTLSIAT